MATVLVVMALPLDFAGRLRVLRTKFLPVALHAVEGARISSLLLHRLRSAFISAVWSRKMPLAHVGDVLTLLDGPAGCDPVIFCCLEPVSAITEVSGLPAFGGAEDLCFAGSSL